jgi:crossover junction endodeoxyribonuclease RuvC
MIVLGIDPGYERLGIAILKKESAKESLIHSTCVRTSAKVSFEKRLVSIGQAVREIITTYHPDVLAIENLFIETNQKTAMRVSEVRGVIIYEAALAGLPIHEYTPLQVKNAITGYGKADKRQVESMLHKLLRLPNIKRLDDEYDAIAIALTGAASIR